MTPLPTYSALAQLRTNSQESYTTTALATSHTCQMMATYAFCQLPLQNK
jgi:hypothetical protein